MTTFLAFPAFSAAAERDCYDIAFVGTIKDVLNDELIRRASPEQVFAPARVDLLIDVRHDFVDDDFPDEVVVRGVVLTSLPERPVLFLLKRGPEGYRSVWWDFAERNWLRRFKSPEDYPEDARLPPRCN
jgi:hypothetical protein